MKVEHVLLQKSSDSYHIGADQALVEAVALMTRHRIGSLMVSEQGVPVSIVTERDVMTAVNSFGSDIANIKVSDVMAPTLITCDADTDLDDAMALMIHNDTGKRIRHLPVFKQGTFLGMLSIGDVVEALLTKTKFENQLLKNYIKHWPDEEKVE